MFVCRYYGGDNGFSTLPAGKVSGYNSGLAPHLSARATIPDLICMGSSSNVSLVLIHFVSTGVA